jgi:TsgA-like MFS transporter
MTHRVSVTLACFLAYCVMSGMLAPIGVVLPPLAEALGVAPAQASALFNWLTFGILGGSALALVIFDLLSLRAAMLLVYLAIAGSLIALRLGEHPWLLRLALGTVGVGCGVGLAGAASTISLLYAADRRASMLVITDGAFSAAGAVTAALATALVAAGLHWASSYLLVAALALLIVVISALVRFPAPAAAVPGRPARPAPRRWPAPVWLCVVALFLYTLGQNAMLWWLPTHLETALGVPRGEAGVVVSRYWTGMFLGQLLVAWWVLRLGARPMALLSVCCAFLGSLPLWLLAASPWLPWFALAWGVMNLGLLKVVIAFASLTVFVPSPRLIAALLFGATLGTAVSPAVTGLIVEAASPLRVLQFSSLCYLVLAVLVAAARRWPAPGLDEEAAMPGAAP